MTSFSFAEIDTAYQILSQFGGKNNCADKLHIFLKAALEKKWGKWVCLDFPVQIL